jgi:hypothetical protein
MEPTLPKQRSNSRLPGTPAMRQLLASQLQPAAWAARARLCRRAYPTRVPDNVTVGGAAEGLDHLPDQGAQQIGIALLDELAQLLRGIHRDVNH